MDTTQTPPEVPKLNLNDEDIEAQNNEGPTLEISDSEAQNSEVPKNIEAQNPEVPPLEITDLENESETKNPLQNYLLPSQMEGGQSWRPETGRFFKGEIPQAFVYKKPNKEERLEGKQNLKAMDEERASRLTKRLLIICAIVGAVIFITIVAVLAVVFSTPDRVEESEGNLFIRDGTSTKSSSIKRVRVPQIVLERVSNE